jgi:D-serine deaminase-like pyridoxal phosphate-dependent protein
MKSKYSYYKEILKDEKLPLAYVDLDLFDQNMNSILSRADGKKIRIASKSIRSVELMRRILDYNNQFQGIMCYSASEAQWLSSLGFDDLLVAYPTVQEKDVLSVLSEIKLGKNIYLMTDSVEHLDMLQRIAEKAGQVLPIAVDLDMSSRWKLLHFGVHRSPLWNMKTLEPYISKLKNCPNLELRAAMGYEAQIAGVGNNMKGKFLFNKLITLLQKKSIAEIAKRRAELVKILKDNFKTLNIVNGGGTGSLESTAKESAVTELTAGSGFYAPVLFDFYSHFKHLPAAGFALETVRKPQPNIYTCLGGGYVASGAIGIEKVPLPYLPEGISLTNNEMAGEVQTPIQYKGELNIGDPVFFRHSKAGELCEHFNELILIKEGKIINKTKTYRGEGNCFLG